MFWYYVLLGLALALGLVYIVGKEYLEFRRATDPNYVKIVIRSVDSGLQPHIVKIEKMGSTEIARYDHIGYTLPPATKAHLYRHHTGKYRQPTYYYDEGVETPLMLVSAEQVKEDKESRPRPEGSDVDTLMEQRVIDVLLMAFRKAVFSAETQLMIIVGSVVATGAVVWYMLDNKIKELTVLLSRGI